MNETYITKVVLPSGLHPNYFIPPHVRPLGLQIPTYQPLLDEGNVWIVVGSYAAVADFITRVVAFHN